MAMRRDLLSHRVPKGPAPSLDGGKVIDEHY
jgi:hypothetical protein